MPNFLKTVQNQKKTHLTRQMIRFKIGKTGIPLENK